MRKFLMFAVVLPLLAVTLAACQIERKSSYFEGKILAEYIQTAASGDDTFSLTFYEPGTYSVKFELTPGKNNRSGRGQEVMPKDFEMTLDTAPRVRIVSQYKLPDSLRVTITHNGVSETHDFR
jgi:hypothetical protein